MNEILDIIVEQDRIREINHATDATFEALKDNLNEGRVKFDNFIMELNMKDRLKFISCGKFYNELKFNQKKAYVKLIMIISIIETINSSEEDYLDFKTWCDKQRGIVKINDSESFGSLLDRLKSQYHKIYGSKQKTLTFFQEYFDQQDQDILRNSFKLEKNLFTNKKLTLEEVVDIIYQMRNNFLHSARFIPFHEEGSIGGNILRNDKEIFVHSDIEMAKFEKMFERAFINFFRKENH